MIDPALPRVAPSRLGAPPPARSHPVGPSGLPIPSARATYRRAEGALLGKLAKAAYDAWVSAELPLAKWEAARAGLEADLATRFPAADMEVLARYDAASPTWMMTVQYDDPYHRALRLDMRSRLLPFRAAVFHADMVGDARAVPVAHRAFFERVRAVELRRARELRELLAWPGQYHARADGWPRWEEIEAAYPALARWMAAERAKMGRARG